jgi:hypothetical protein
MQQTPTDFPPNALLGAPLFDGLVKETKMMVSKVLIAALVTGLGTVSTASAAGLWNETAPTYGGDSDVVSPNASPPGFSDNTPQDLRAHQLAEWFNSQNRSPYTDSKVAQPPR